MELAILCLPFQTIMDIAKADAQLYHGIFGIQGICSEEIIWRQSVSMLPFGNDRELTQGVRIARTGI